MTELSNSLVSGPFPAMRSGPEVIVNGQGFSTLMSLLLENAR
jgi:hypothetical protein